LFSNNSESVVLGQLGSNSSLRFLGPNLGVLPIGPNSIPGLDRLPHSPLSDAGTNAAILSYNYTLHHQGVTNNISCFNDTQSPITYLAGPRDDFGNVTGSCNETGLHNPLNLLRNYDILDTYSTLAMWGCYSEQDQVYHLYLRGCGMFYEKEIGNITCSVSPIQSAVFPVTYQSSTNVFSTQEQVPASATPSVFSPHTTYSAVESLLRLVIMAQNPLNNQIAESVKDLGIQALWLQPPNYQYLPLYEAMIQGMLMDIVCTANNSSLPLLMTILQLTYWRFRDSMQLLDTPPASCIRTVNGTMSAEVTGWVAKPVHIAFLMPMTMLNLASLALALVSIVKTGRTRSPHDSDPTDPRSLLLANYRLNGAEPSGWSDGVLYHSREVRKCHYNSGADR